MRMKLSTLTTVLVFVVATSMLTLLVGLTFGRVRLDDSRTYELELADASGLKSGSDVRAAGVPVGTVKSVDLSDDNRVIVRITVSTDVPVTDTTAVRVRYANLTGDRFVYLDQTAAAPGGPLEDGARIPLARTAPALDLDDFFAGFDPLMRALDPEEINDLTANLIAVTDGQAGAIGELLATVASFTDHLADRDELIGAVITDLSAALTTVNRKREDVNRLVNGLADLTRGYAADSEAIGSSLVDVNRLAADTERVLRRNRAAIKANIDQVGKTSKNLLSQRKVVEDTLRIYPEVIQRLGRGGAYGSFFNFFLCSARVYFDTGNGKGIYTPELFSTADRCLFPADDSEGKD